MRLFKIVCPFLLLFCLTGVSQAGNALKPFVLAYTAQGGIDAVAEDVKARITAAGFDIVGSYKPYHHALVIAITSDSLKKLAASGKEGGYVAGQRIGLTRVGKDVQVAYTNPVYWGSAYRLNDVSGLRAVAASLAKALGKTKAFGTGELTLSAGDLRKYHYMFGMEYFDDPSELAEYASYEQAVEAVEQGLSAGRGGARKVYRIDIPGRDETVFGVALTTRECGGDEYVMSRIDKGELRSTAHLPYEILVSGGNVHALYARFRIAISWPHLPMVQSDDGATFFNIMCAPNAIEEALIRAAGGDV